MKVKPSEYRNMKEDVHNSYSYSEENSPGYIGGNNSLESDESTTPKPAPKKQKAKYVEELHICDGCQYTCSSKEDMVSHTRFIHTKPQNIEEHTKTWTSNLAIVENSSKKQQLTVQVQEQSRGILVGKVICLFSPGKM